MSILADLVRGCWEKTTTGRLDDKRYKKWERERRARTSMIPKSGKNVSKKCPSFFLPVHFFLHFLPSLFGRELEGIVKSTLTQPY